MSLKYERVLPLIAIIIVLIALVLHKGLDLSIKAFYLTGVTLKIAKILTLLVSILLPLWVTLRILRLSPQSTLGFYRPSWKKALPVVALGFGVALVSAMVLQRVVPLPPDLLAEMADLVRFENVSEFILVVLLSVATAPVADELLFRGFVFRSFLERFGPLPALIVSAILTGVFHWEPWMILYGTLMGFIFAGVVLWTGSVYTSILLHALLNSLALIPKIQ
ncbi:MAG: CPBP family intramembrane glutamic endopeptidase [Acidobacteriota bacterium]